MINGQKPNWPSDGYQSEEKISVPNLFELKSPEDLNTRPAPIAKGKSRQNIRQLNIHFEETPSINFLESTMAVICGW